MAISGAKRIYLYNMKKALQSRQEAFGMQEMFAGRIKETYEVLPVFAMIHAKILMGTLVMKQGLYHSNETLLSDSRSHYHLQTACLVLSSYRVLTGQLRLSHQDALAVVQRCMGDSDSLMERLLRRFFTPPHPPLLFVSSRSIRVFHQLVIIFVFEG
jgi:hypothetical protein